MDTGTECETRSHAETQPARETQTLADTEMNHQARGDPHQDVQRDTLNKRERRKKPPPPPGAAPTRTTSKAPSQKPAFRPETMALLPAQQREDDDTTPTATEAQAQEVEPVSEPNAASMTHPTDSTVSPGDSMNAHWPQPLDKLVLSEMPKLREAVQEWRRNELELRIEKRRRMDQSEKIKRFLAAKGLGQYADVLQHGRYCGPRALAQLQALLPDELIQFCESVDAQHTRTSNNDDFDSAASQVQPRCCRSRRVGTTAAGILVLILVTIMGMCSSTTLGCAL